MSKTLLRHTLIKTIFNIFVDFLIFIHFHKSIVYYRLCREHRHNPAGTYETFSTLTELTDQFLSLFGFFLSIWDSYERFINIFHFEIFVLFLHYVCSI
jgi:hypothetical protein